jgi:hypothetical protein
MCPSRISRAASTTEADAPIERGFSLIASRTLFTIRLLLVYRLDRKPGAPMTPDIALGVSLEVDVLSVKSEPSRQHLPDQRLTIRRIR